MGPDRLRQILDPIIQWVKRRPDLLGLALVGSWARGTAREDSDVDLVLLAEVPEALRRDTAWPFQIAWSDARLEPVDWSDADYGRAWSRHLRLRPDVEIELSFAAPGWAEVDPIDEGTLRIVADGFEVLLDKAGLLGRLQASVQCARRPTTGGS
jgi:predicted nucleotidyltransferase